MSSNNGKAMSEVDVLKAENVALRQRMQAMAANLHTKDQHATLVTQYVCGILHKQGWNEYVLDGADMEACYRHNMFRVRAKWEDSKSSDEHRKVVLTLVRVTPEEQAALDEAKRVQEQAEVEAASKAEAEDRAADALVDALANRGKRAVRDTVLAWTPAQRKIAEKWAEKGDDNVPLHVRALPDMEVMP